MQMKYYKVGDKIIIHNLEIIAQEATLKIYVVEVV